MLHFMILLEVSCVSLPEHIGICLKSGCAEEQHCPTPAQQEPVQDRAAARTVVADLGLHFSPAKDLSGKRKKPSSCIELQHLLDFVD